MRKLISMALLLVLPVSSFAADTVFKITVGEPAGKVYDKVYENLEAARFFVVFEPNIGKNLSGFADRWGDEYNQNKLTSLRAMVFCNGWYANQVSNKDPDMLGLCPLHLTVIERDGKTSVLFNRPTVIAADSPALSVLKEVETEVIAAIRKSVN